MATQVASRRSARPVPRRVAVVLAGAGARGAYEAGVLSVVLPRLERAGIRPHLFVGTSAGAINAALFAASAHLPARQQADAVLEVWRGIRAADVFRSIVTSAPRTAGRWAGQRLGFPGARLSGLLDTAPLTATAQRMVDWDRLRANLDAGHLAGLAVVATSARTGRAVVFVDQPAAAGPSPADDSRPMDYVPVQLGAGHVLASAAIPVVFPAAPVDTPEPAVGWYADGGIRLNAPLKPALALGADALVVVATHPDGYPPQAQVRPGDGRRPAVDDVVVQLMDAALVDPMVEDLRTLRKVNELVAAGGRRRPGRRAYQQVPHLFFGPAERGSLAALAAAAYRQRFGGLGGAIRTLRDPDLPLLALLFGGDGARRGDLLSYLLFDRRFVDLAIEQGRQDALRVLGGAAGGDLPWADGGTDRTDRTDRTGRAAQAAARTDTGRAS